MDFFDAAEVAAFRNSGHFDEDWYLEQYPDVAMTGMDPAVHYLWLGIRLGRRPSPDHDPGTAFPRGQVALATNENPSEAVPQTKGSGVRATFQKFQNRSALKILTAEMREKIARSGLFDEEYYRRTYGERIVDEGDLLADYVLAFRHDPARDPGPLFSTHHYLKMHPDVRGVHPLVHYLQWGMDEGRAAFSAENVNAFLADANANLHSLFDILPKDGMINILYWADGNFFFADVATYLELLLREQGYRATARTALPASHDGSLNLVVAPHEFCALGPGKNWTDAQRADAAYVNTEQWQTSWFSLSLKYLQNSKIGVFDLNPSSAQGLAVLGIPTAFLPLLPLPGSNFDFQKEDLSDHVRRLKFIDELTYPEALSERPYDVLCCGVLNDRRSHALARMARKLSAYRNFIHMPRFNRPIKPGEPDVLSASDFAQLARNSKIMLNIHQGETHYLEWQRVFLVGMMQGAVVVSEPCYANDYVKPGVHYVEAHLENMDAVVNDLLSTPSGQEKMNRIHQSVRNLRDAIACGERMLG